VQDDIFDDTIIADARSGDSVAAAELDFADTILIGIPAAVEKIPAGELPTEEDDLPPVDTVLHYHLRIGVTVVALDKVAYIGRKPSAPRVMLDGVPRLIQVPSPLREVSSTHIEVRQRGSNVVLTDLRSTNGSLINIPGRSPRKLCRGESLVVTAGTLVDIGDGNLVEILPMQRV